MRENRLDRGRACRGNQGRESQTVQRGAGSWRIQKRPPTEVMAAKKTPQTTRLRLIARRCLEALVRLDLPLIGLVRASRGEGINFRELIPRRSRDRIQHGRSLQFTHGVVLGAGTGRHICCRPDSAGPKPYSFGRRRGRRFGPRRPTRPSDTGRRTGCEPCRNGQRAIVHRFCESGLSQPEAPTPVAHRRQRNQVRRASPSHERSVARKKPL